MSNTADLLERFRQVDAAVIVAGATETAGIASLREFVTAGYRVLGTVRPGGD